MTAKWELQRLHEPVVVLIPDSEEEAILMAAFLKYDSNAFRVSVDRREDGLIKNVRIFAEQSQ